MTAADHLTVVFVSYNSGDVLDAALRAVADTLSGAEIVVVDNGSTDASECIALNRGARLVAGHGNVGFGAGVNLGVEAAGRSHVLVLNPDATIDGVDDGKLDALLARQPFGVAALVERHGGALSPLLRPVYPWPGELIWLLYAWFIAPGGSHVPRPRWPGFGTRFSGAAFIVERDAFLRLGGFDERLFLYHEDEELSLRYSRAGAPVDATDAVVVRHEQGTSSPRTHERILAWQLLSFVEVCSFTRSDRSTRRVARSVVWGLRFIRASGRALRRTPLIGAKAAAKADSAQHVLSHLAAEASSPPRGSTYPAASRAVAALTRSLPR